MLIGREQEIKMLQKAYTCSPLPCMNVNSMQGILVCVPLVTTFLHNEFNELYDSLFNEPESYLKLINALGTIRMGMTRDELVQLVDNFTIFYFKYMKANHNNDEHFWSNSYNSPLRSAWTGLATQCYSWRTKATDSSVGAQIDMVLDRADNIINICEIKFSKGEYALSKEYMVALNNKLEKFIAATKTKKSLLLTMLTTNGVAHNEYWNQIQSEITADHLFM